MEIKKYINAVFIQLMLLSIASIVQMQAAQADAVKITVLKVQNKTNKNMSAFENQETSFSVSPFTSRKIDAELAGVRMDGSCSIRFDMNLGKNKDSMFLLVLCQLIENKRRFEVSLFEDMETICAKQKFSFAKDECTRLKVKLANKQASVSILLELLKNS
jgi:hypothetical protein